MPPLTQRPRRRTSTRPTRLGMGVLAVALISAGVLASCDRAQTRRVAADARDAARQTAAGLDHAAAQAEPAADRAAESAKRAADDLAIAAGRATRKAGVQLEHAGERAQRGTPPPGPARSN